MEIYILGQYLSILYRFIKCQILIKNILNTAFMRFGANLSVFIIPQWKQCYIDYETLKIFVVIIKQLVEHIQTIDLLSQSDETVNQITQQSQGAINLSSNTESYKLFRCILMTKLKKIDKLFREQYLLQIQMAQIFYQMKTLELKVKFKRTQQIGSRQLDNSQLPKFLMLIQNIYVQSKFLEEMTLMNLQGERKILKKHKKCAKKMIDTPSSNHSKINRFKKLNIILIDQVQNYYVQKNIFQEQTKDRRDYLRKTAQKAATTNMDSILLGLWVGISISLLVVVIVIIQVNNLNLQNNLKFARDFPTWRGIATLIFYLWVLGFNIYMFQEYKITHRTIFVFDDHHYSSSVSMFKIAGFHTSLFLIFFLLYVLKLTNVFALGGFNEAYFALLSWGIFILLIFLPLPIFNLNGRIFAFKLIFKSIISPFFGVTFPIIWLTDQVVSLITPLKDFAYTVCYYTEIDFSTNKNPCTSNTKVEVVLMVAIVAFGYRMLQCIRQGYDKGEYFCTPFFLNTMKYASSLITAILAFQYKLGVSQMFSIWIIFAAISTVYSYLWDLKMDWNLLQTNDRHKFLRKYLSFQPARNYYIIAISNLIMRLAWVFTLSPSITATFGNANILTLVTGMVQIFRRGIWNLLRVQKQHLQNCGDFKAVPDTTDIQNKLSKFDNPKDIALMFIKFSELFSHTQKEIHNQFLILIRQLIARKEEANRIYNSQFQKDQIKEINQLMKQVLQINPKLLQKLKKEKKKKKKTKLLQIQQDED